MTSEFVEERRVLDGQGTFFFFWLRSALGFVLLRTLLDLEGLSVMISFHAGISRKV